MVSTRDAKWISQPSTVLAERYPNTPQVKIPNSEAHRSSDLTEAALDKALSVAVRCPGAWQHTTIRIPRTAELRNLLDLAGAELAELSVETKCHVAVAVKNRGPKSGLLLGNGSFVFNLLVEVG